MAEEEIEYESDPEEAKLSLKVRRKEASDDEEGVDGNGQGKPPRSIDDSESESEGAAAEYEDALEEEYFEEEKEHEESGSGTRGGDEVEVAAEERVDGGRGEVTIGTLSEGMVEMKSEMHNASEIDYGNSNNAEVENEEDRKEIEPFSVPTAGAFYMHDDRFRDNVGGRNRRILGGRKFWESKDDRKWGHDKFEELTMQAKDREEPRRGSRGRYRGRGRNQGANRGYSQGNRHREYASNQNNAPKGARGRGPQRYQPSSKSSTEAPVAQKRHSERTSQHVSNTEPDAVPPKKQVSSNLSIASPPFYPTSSSPKDSTIPIQRDALAGTINQNGQQSVVDENKKQSVGSAKNTADYIGLDKLHIADSPASVAGKTQNNIMQVPVSSSMSMAPSQPQVRGQGRRQNSLSQMAYRPTVASNQTNRAPPPNQHQSFQRNPNQSRIQSSVQASVQGLPSRRQASSPPKAVGAGNTYESREAESTSETSQVKSALVAKGKGGVPGNGKGSFLYGGAPVMGASSSMASGHSDQNFPAFLPVMQFGGQHPGGVGVPAVGMAFPGYVAQPQHGIGSSEMTWLPLLAGAAGALGTSYCPPYINVDGSYNIRPPGQVPSTSSKETNAAQISNNLSSTQEPELANDDFGRRQKNPRRYTEMKFDQ